MRDILLVFSVIVGWYVLNRWVLPSMGVKT